MWRKFSAEQILLTFIITLFFSISFVSAHTITVPTDVYFGIPQYGTYINFSTEQTFDEIYRESNYWNFVTIGEATYKFQVQNGNMTITDLFVSDSNKLTFTVTGDSGVTSTTKVYCGVRGEPMAIYTANGTLTWSYNTSTTILTLNVTHASPARILVYWKFPGDTDSDGDVDIYDLYILAVAYGSHVEEPNYNSDCDIDGNDHVNSNDLRILAEDY